MSDYTKIQNWASLAGTAINGAPFDTEFASVAAASATKANKNIPATVNNLASLSSAGDLQDSGILDTDVTDAVSFHYTTGDIKATAVDSEPTGWLYADGASYSTSTYADLFAAIGYTYGGSGASFNVPDLRGTVIAGMDNLGGASANNITDVNADSLGGTVGAETHTLTEAELPSHSHTGTADSPGDHTHTMSAAANVGTSLSRAVRGDGTTVGQFGTGLGAGHQHPLTVDNTGSDAGHANVQPTLFINYLIKT